MDEQNHLARGLAFLHSGDPRLSLEHPPLVNSLSALPLLTLPTLHIPFDDPSWVDLAPAGAYWYFFADKLLWQANQDVTRMIFLARLPIIFLTIGLALLGYRFARALWGRTAVPFALFLFLFEPNLLAHGRLTTTDLGGTFFNLLAFYLVWQLWQTPQWHWPRWAWTAVGLGLSFSSKLSTLSFVPILGLLAILPLYPTSPPAPYWQAVARRLAQLISAGCLALLVTWACFGFEWGVFRFASDRLAFLNSYSGPMPTFWAGIDQILNVSRDGRSTFLLGQFSNNGFWHYFPVAFLVKTPLAILLSFPIALLAGWRRPAGRTAVLFLCLPACLYFGISIWSGVNIGYRHLLPMLPFLLLLIVGLVGHGRGRFLLAVFTAVLLLETLTAHPHYLSFFNQAAGGPANGHTLLIDSNIDWGQDLRRLKTWMDAQGVDTINLGWFGTARPDYYGIHYQPLPGLGGVGQPAFFDAWWQQPPPFNPTQPEPGLYAISATSLQEFPLQDDEKLVYAWFRQRPPDARIGYSIFIYEVP